MLMILTRKIFRKITIKSMGFEMQKQEFLKVFKMLCTGIVVNEEK